MKKIKILFFCGLMIAATMTGHAQSGTTGGLAWSISGSTLTISGTGAMPDYDNSDAPPWASYRTSIEKAVIGYGVTTIGMYAFFDCSSLMEVTVPNSVTSIGSEAFRFCGSLPDVALPNSVNYIGVGAFDCCSSLIEVAIPDLVTEILESTFSNCSSLEKVTVGNSVNYIGWHAFESCSSLENITIPGSVTNIEPAPFRDCSSLTGIIVDDGNTDYFHVNGVLFKYDQSTLVQYPCGRQGGYSIPGGVAAIGYGAFAGCEHLNEVTVPNSVESIGEHAFWGCIGLTSITIPNSVTTIGNAAFRFCTGLTYLFIPSSVTFIDGIIFENCSSLVVIEVDVANADYSSLDGVLFNKDQTRIINYPGAKGDYTIPETVKTIGGGCFANCKELTSIIIPNSVEIIEGNVFWECTNLANVIFGSSITFIDWGVFEACTGLRNVTVNWTDLSMVSVDEFAFGFYNEVNKSEVNLHIPAYTYDLYIDAPVWKDFNIVQSWEIGAPIPADVIAALDKSTLTVSGAGAMQDFDNNTLPPWASHRNAITDLVIGSGVTTIGDYAFAGCESLTEIAIPNSVVTIGDQVFSNCSSLIEVDIPNSVTTIGQWAFIYCTSLIEVTVPNSVTTIFWGAFDACSNLTEINIGNSVTDMGPFSACSRLSSINVDVANNVFSSVDGVLFNKNKTMLKQYPCGKPEIGYIIPGSVTAIADYAFIECSSLIEVTIPNSVISIGHAAFRDCSSLIEVTVPNSVTFIDNEAFSGCIVLTEITNHASVPQPIEANVFTGVDISQITLRVPACYLNSYLAADVWKDFGAFEAIKPCETIIAGGDVTETITWTLCDDGVLIICGTGEMPDYGYDNSPWNEHRKLITTVVIGNGVTSIGNNAFSSCSNLSEVIIPNSVITIGVSAFSYTQSLIEVTIPNSVTAIGAFAFFQCSSLSAINVNEENNQYSSVNGVLFNKDQTTLIQFPNGKHGEYTLPGSVITIERYAFPWSTHLTEVTIPNSVTFIEINSFYYCDNLTAINVNEDNSQYSSINGVLFNKDQTTLIQYPGGKHGVYTIPDGVTSIGDYAFFSCRNLNEVFIPNSVTSIGNSSYSFCSSLTSVTVQWINPISMVSIDEQAFLSVNVSNVNLYIPGGAYDLYAAAPVWKDFNIVQSWEIGAPIPADVIAALDKSTLTVSGVGAMQDFDNNAVPPWTSHRNSITDLVIGSGVTTIGDYAFAGCESLTEVDIPNSVTTIGNYAFSACSGLIEIYNHAGAPQSIHTDVFDDVDISKVTLYVPASSVSAYQDAPVWRDFIISVTGGQISGAALMEIPVPQIITINSITVYEIQPPATGQSVEYAIVENVPLSSRISAWQPDRTFNELHSDALYYVFARSAGNVIYFAGEAVVSKHIMTHRNFITNTGEPEHIAPLKAWVRDGLLHVSGLSAGEVWSVYSISGVLVYRSIAAGSDVYAGLSAEGTYIVQSGERTIKVVFN